MSRLKLSLLLFLCVVVSACSQFAPFEDRQREPGTVYIFKGDSKPGKPAICYNPMFYNQDEIRARADKLCQENKAGTHAEFVDVDYFSCRLFVPSKAHYKCVADTK